MNKKQKYRIKHYEEWIKFSRTRFNQNVPCWKFVRNYTWNSNKPTFKPLLSYERILNYTRTCKGGNIEFKIACKSSNIRHTCELPLRNESELNSRILMTFPTEIYANTYISVSFSRSFPFGLNNISLSIGFHKTEVGIKRKNSIRSFFFELEGLEIIV